MPRLAIIILNWNGKELLGQFLPGVVASTRQATQTRPGTTPQAPDCQPAGGKEPEVELMVADNGSTDGSQQWLRGQEVTLLELGRNLGFAEGYNRAIARTGAEYVLLLNSDVEVRPGWWQPLLAFMEAHPKAGACQPKILSQGNPGEFEYAGAAGGLLDNLGYPYCRGRLFDKLEADCGQYDSRPERVAWASGAAMMVRRSAWEEAGGLDPRFFAHMEEIDLCWRMQRLGWEIWAVPESRVWHVGGASLPQGDPKKTYLNFRNNLLLLQKNLPKERNRRTLLLRRLADTLAWTKFMASLDLKNANAILRAHRDFRKMRSHYPAPENGLALEWLPGGERSALKLRWFPAWLRGRKGRGR